MNQQDLFIEAGNEKSANWAAKGIVYLVLFAMQFQFSWSFWGYTLNQNLAYADEYRQGAEAGYGFGTNLSSQIKENPPVDQSKSNDPALQNKIKLGTQRDPFTGVEEPVYIDRDSMMPLAGEDERAAAQIESQYGNSSGQNAAANQIYSDMISEGPNTQRPQAQAIQLLSGRHGGTNPEIKADLSKDSMFSNTRSAIDGGVNELYGDCKTETTTTPVNREVSMSTEHRCFDTYKPEACTITRTINETEGPKSPIGNIYLNQDHGSRFKIRLMDLPGGLDCQGGRDFNGMPACMAAQGSFFQALDADYLAGVASIDVQLQPVELPEPGTTYKFSFTDLTGQCNRFDINDAPRPENDYVLDLYVQCTAPGYQFMNLQVSLQKIYLNSSFTESEPGCLKRAHSFGDEFCQGGTPITHTEEFKRKGTHIIDIPKRAGATDVLVVGGGGGGAGGASQEPQYGEVCRTKFNPETGRDETVCRTEVTSGGGGGGGGGGHGQVFKGVITPPDEAESLTITVGSGAQGGQAQSSGGTGSSSSISFGSQNFVTVQGGSGGSPGGAVQLDSDPQVSTGGSGGSSGGRSGGSEIRGTGGNGGIYGEVVEDKQGGPGGVEGRAAGYGKRGGGGGGGALQQRGGFGGNGYVRLTYSGNLNADITCTDDAPRSLPKTGAGLTPALAKDSALDTMYLGEFYDGKVCFQATIGNACQYNETVSQCYTDINGNQQCPEGNVQEESCAQYENDSKCSFVERKCVEEGASKLDEKTCYVYQTTYKCSESQTVTEFVKEESFSCGGFRCMGEDCFGTEQEKNKDFAKATTGLNAMNSAKQDMECSNPEDPNSCQFFKGKALECKKAVGGVQDCCDQPTNVSLVDYLKTAFLGAQMSDRIGMTQALTGNETVSGYFYDALEPVGSSLADFGRNLMSPIDELMASTATSTASDAAVGAAMQEGASSGAEASFGNQLYEQVGGFIDETFGQAAKDFGLITPDSILSDQIANVFGTVMSVYTAVQLAIAVIQIVFACEEPEFELAAKRELRSCHLIGSYCKTKAAFACIETRTASCCFNSPLSRIMQEEIREQLGISWGTAREPSCQGLTIAQFEQVNWDEINLDEYVGLMASAGLGPGPNTNPDQAYSMERVTSQFKQTDDGADARTPDARTRIEGAVGDSGRFDDLRSTIRNNSF